MAIAENKATSTVENLRELSSRSSQLEAIITKIDLRNDEHESRAILTEQEAVKFEGEAKISKETLTIIKHLMRESHQKSVNIRKEPHAMHLELPSISSLVNYHADDEVGPSSERVDFGRLLDVDYFHFMTDDHNELS
ncbi:hypothetical protein LWI28_001844 [Acer negundo]|uniref:Uncharacterized protein n=1 Tax=Acer negundo TaxID=4023 RepID=A0AAD5NVH0_ACENE|nr:hypothetical protein LWI28_001844 [Acer negundo]